MIKSQGLNSRANGFLAGRPNVEQLRIKKVQHDRAMKLGSKALADCVRFWRSLLYDSSKPIEARLRASENLASRCGLPMLHAVHNMDEVISTPKLVEHRRFDAPGTFSDTPTDEVMEAMKRFADEQATGGNGTPSGNGGTG